MSRSEGRKFRRKIRPNYFYAIISVALVLIIAGLFSLLILHGRGLIRNFKERVNLLVEIRELSSEEEIARFETFLKQQPYLRKGSLTYISKEEAFKELQADFEDIMQMDLPNPLYNMFEFNLQAAWLQQDSLQAIKRQLLKQPPVQDVFYQEGVVAGLTQNIRNLALIALGLSLLLLIVATTLIYNTNKLSLYANRFIIKNMQLVGASWRYIARPYLLRSALHGLFSGLLAGAVLGGVLYYLYQNIPDLKGILELRSLFFLFLALLIAGVLINMSSTLYTIFRYLRMRTDDLY